jgi:hypothetical protein
MSRRAFLLLISLLAFSPSVRAGAWGVGSFDNDDALDWAAECAASRDLSVVSTALNSALKSGYLEAPQASAAIAAAEVIAAALGRPSSKMPKQLFAWVRAQPQDAVLKLSALAQKAISRILGDHQSELRELWKDTKEFSAWQTSLKDLLVRLK